MDYRKALETAILFIEEHLGEDITVEDVAAAAGYSYYHLTRQFTAVLGESVGSYIKKRRLADAAKKLIYTDKRVLDIALENGFDAGEAFSRAFKAAYKVSPHAYRKNRLDLLITAKRELDPEQLDHRMRNMTVHPRIVEMPEIKVAGLRGQTTLADNVIRQLWDKFNALAGQIPHRVPGGRGFGICEACVEGTHLSRMSDQVLFSEVAGVEVASFDGLPDPFIAKVLPAGRFAVFTHRGTLSRITDTFNYISSTWFLSTGETLDDREDFELYDHRYTGYDDPYSEVDIYMPIK